MEALREQEGRGYAPSSSIILSAIAFCIAVVESFKPVGSAPYWIGLITVVVEEAALTVGRRVAGEVLGVAVGEALAKVTAEGEHPARARVRRVG